MKKLYFCLILCLSSIQTVSAIDGQYAWSISEDGRVWLKLLEGEQVGFSKVAFLMDINESVRINGRYYLSNVSGINIYNFRGNMTIQFSFRGLEGKIIVDDTLEIESQKEIVNVGVFRVRIDAVVYFVPSAFVGIILGAYVGRKLRRKFEAII